jgi:hypothetical protein
MVSLRQRLDALQRSFHMLLRRQQAGELAELDHVVRHVLTGSCRSVAGLDEQV